MEMVCDKFHFKNHTDSWCKRNCNPYNSSILQKPVRVKRANLNIIPIRSCHRAPAVDVVAAPTHCLKVEELCERGQQY
ncbi:hypothetical protein P5673_026765 [Acropora cervicornis]|uniref:Uncharacterized protein n=1 Tax=Acropora cervicornis TaxID=6130 RepID=A0AAD9Q090_ACRCE|nr:hypothetical protein P5673_026765 [Acropora cervicornis]